MGIRVDEVEDNETWLIDHFSDAFDIEDGPKIGFLAVFGSNGILVNRNEPR